MTKTNLALAIIIVILLFMLWRCRNEEQRVKKVLIPRPEDKLDLSKFSDDELRIRRTAINRMLSALDYHIYALSSYKDKNPDNEQVAKRLEKAEKERKQLKDQLDKIGERLSG